jgi:hypothetical protein
MISLAKQAITFYLSKMTPPKLSDLELSSEDLSTTK